MRQGNGTEILGVNDPRSAAIGIIYVSPNDDRKSVLAAIITQEKLGRKQVAVVLPNRAASLPPLPVGDERSLPGEHLFGPPGSLGVLVLGGDQKGWIRLLA